MSVVIQSKVSKQEVLVLFIDNEKKILGAWKDKALEEYLQLALDKDFSGNWKENIIIYTPSHPLTKRVLLVGVGNKNELHLQRLRILAATLISSLRERNLSKSVSLLVPKLGKLRTEEIIQAIETGSRIYQFRFDELKTQNETSKKKNLSEIEIQYLVSDAREQKPAEKAVHKARTIAGGVNFARRLIMLSPRQLNPEELARQAVKMAQSSPSKSKIKTKVWTEKELQKNKYGGILAVGQGSDTPPRFIQLEYWGTKATQKPIVLVGKGITFDSGGLSLKPPPSQETMKYDMAGAASVLGVFKIVTELQLKTNLIVLVPSAENMPSGKAQRPGDIITMASGKTVEVLNTDAEGRLILADALYHGTTHFKPKSIIDVATLTGACALAVGEAAAGLFGNNDALKADLMKATKTSGENLWPLPDFDDFYADLLKSDAADLKNIGKREAGASTAAIFLRHFVMNDVPWAHLDIAGCGWYDGARDFIGMRGPSGVPVRLLFDYVESQA